MAKPQGTNAETFQATNRALLNAARAEFVRVGYDQAAMTRIAATCRAVRGSVYYHFGSKLNLFQRVHAEVEADLTKRLLEQARLMAEPWTRFLSIQHGYIEACTNAEVRQVLLIDGPRVLPSENIRGAELGVAMMVREIQLLIDAKVFRPVPVEAAARLIFGALERAGLMVAEHPEDRVTRADVITAFDALVGGLRR